jgi:hypothetical protein
LGPVQLTVTFAATQFNFKFKLPSTKSITIFWGDGTSEAVVGTDAVLITKTSSYSTAGTYSFYVTGDATELTYIDIQAQAFVSGDISGWSALTNLTELDCSSTSVSGDVSVWSALTNLTRLDLAATPLTGDVSVWSALTSLTTLLLGATSLTGDISGWSALTNLTSLSIQDTAFTGDVSAWSALTSLTALRCDGTSLTGDISSWSALTSLTSLRCEDNAFTGDVSAWSTLTSLTTLRANNNDFTFDNTPAWSNNGADLRLFDNSWTSGMVDNSLASFAGGPVTNSTLNVAGNNAARTSGSDADKVTILANSNTLTVNE